MTREHRFLDALRQAAAAVDLEGRSAVKPADSRELWRLGRSITDRDGERMRREVVGQVIRIRPIPTDMVGETFPPGFWLEGPEKAFSGGNFETPELAAAYLARYGIVADRPVTLTSMVALPPPVPVPHYMGAPLDAPPNPTVYHLYPDCVAIGAWEAQEVTPEHRATYGELRDCKRCLRRRERGRVMGHCCWCERDQVELVATLVADPDQRVCADCHADDRVPTEPDRPA